MAKVSPVSRGRTNIKIGRTESALVFTPSGVHNALSEDSRHFIDNMLTKGEAEAFKDITPEKFWTVVLPAVTYVKMAQYVKEVQASNTTADSPAIATEFSDSVVLEPGEVALNAEEIVEEETTTVDEVSTQEEVND